MADRLLNVTEAAAMLGLKPSTLYQWAYERRIAHVKMGGALRFRLSAVIPAGGNWSASGSGVKYKDRAAANAGIKKVILKASSTNSAKAVVSGKGMNLPDPALMLTGPVTAQLINSDTSVCFTASYTGAQIIVNTTESFKGKPPDGSAADGSFLE